MRKYDDFFELYGYVKLAKSVRGKCSEEVNVLISHLISRYNWCEAHGKLDGDIFPCAYRFLGDNINWSKSKLQRVLAQVEEIGIITLYIEKGKFLKISINKDNLFRLREYGQNDLTTSLGGMVKMTWGYGQNDLLKKSPTLNYNEGQAIVEKDHKNIYKNIIVESLNLDDKYNLIWSEHKKKYNKYLVRAVKNFYKEQVLNFPNYYINKDINNPSSSIIINSLNIMVRIIKSNLYNYNQDSLLQIMKLTVSDSFWNSNVKSIPSFVIDKGNGRKIDQIAEKYNLDGGRILDEVDSIPKSKVSSNNYKKTYTNSNEDFSNIDEEEYCTKTYSPRIFKTMVTYHDDFVKDIDRKTFVILSVRLLDWYLEEIKDTSNKYKQPKEWHEPSYYPNFGMIKKYYQWLKKEDWIIEYAIHHFLPNNKTFMKFCKDEARFQNVDPFTKRRLKD